MSIHDQICWYRGITALCVPNRCQSIPHPVAPVAPLWMADAPGTGWRILPMSLLSWLMVGNLPFQPAGQTLSWIQKLPHVGVRYPTLLPTLLRPPAPTVSLVMVRGPSRPSRRWLRRIPAEPFGTLSGGKLWAIRHHLQSIVI